MSSTQDQFSVTNSHVSKDYTTINLDREFHNEKAATYWLPKDDDEQRRLTGQHFAYKELFEGNILSSVRNILDFNKGVSILDIGCGSGVWMMVSIKYYYTRQLLKFYARFIGHES